MSSMLSGPAPDAINIGGPLHGTPAGPPPGAPSPGPGANNLGGDGEADPAAVKQNLQAALKSLRAAEDAEGDDADGAQIAQLVAKIKTLIAAHQGLEDKVMGGGPGVKMIRKTTSNAPAAPPSGGGY